MTNTWDTPDHCDTCQREMYGFTRDGALICKPCQFGDDLCTYCDGAGFEGGELGEPCYPCGSTGKGGAESRRALAARGEGVPAI